jgi:transposase
MTQKKKRRRWTPQQKLKLVLESLQSDETMAAICRREGVSPAVLHQWRQQLLKSADAIFADKRSQRGGDDSRVAKLSAEAQQMKDVIAEITAENLVLKKTLSD